MPILGAARRVNLLLNSEFEKELIKYICTCIFLDFSLLVLVLNCLIWLLEMSMLLLMLTQGCLWWPHFFVFQIQSKAYSMKSLLLLQDGVEGSKPLTAFRSFDNQNRRELVRVPVRSKSVLSAFFVKQKTPKLKAGSVSWNSWRVKTKIKSWKDPHPANVSPTCLLCLLHSRFFFFSVSN